MREKVIKLYNFDELSDEAKKQAIDTYRGWNTDGIEWWNYIYESSIEAAAMLGIDIEDISFSGFSHQGDGALFTGGYEYKKGGLAAVKKEYPVWRELHEVAEGLQELQKANGYGLSARVTASASNYCHSNSVMVDVFKSEEWADDISAVEDVRQLMKDFMDDVIYKSLGRAYEELTSDEEVSDGLIATEAEFTEDGKIFYS